MPNSHVITDHPCDMSPRTWAHSWALRRHLPFLCAVLRLVAALFLRAWLRLYHRLEIEGRENLPAGRFVLVANHASHLDALCLLAALPLGRLRHVYPAAAADYFFTRPLRQAVAEVVVNALPFDRYGDSAGSLELCRQLLANAETGLIYFPEGTRSTTGEMERFRSGIGRLVTASRVPVVPCHLEGCGAAWPPGQALPGPRKVRLRIGRPRFHDGMDAHSIAGDLQEAVAKLEAHGGQPTH